jgi:hypothetical protein
MVARWVWPDRCSSFASPIYQISTSRLIRWKYGTSLSNRCSFLHPSPPNFNFPRWPSSVTDGGATFPNLVCGSQQPINLPQHVEASVLQNKTFNSCPSLNHPSPDSCQMNIKSLTAKGHRAANLMSPYNSPTTVSMTFLVYLLTFTSYIASTTDRKRSVVEALSLSLSQVLRHV